MTVVAPTTPYGYTIFCDDIRMEAGNKPSFMGVYAGLINLHQPLPFKFAKFCFAINYIERPGESTDPATLSIYLPGDAEDAPSIKAELPVETMRSQEPPADTELEDPVMRLALNIIAAPLEIKSGGLIKVRVHRGDLEIKLGTIRVHAPTAEDKSSN